MEVTRRRRARPLVQKEIGVGLVEVRGAGVVDGASLGGTSTWPWKGGSKNHACSSNRLIFRQNISAYNKCAGTERSRGFALDRNELIIGMAFPHIKQMRAN